MLDLPVRHVGVLLGGVEVEAGAGGIVVAQDYLLARLVLGADVVEGEFVGAVFAPPGQGGLQPFEGVGGVPLGRA